MKKGIESLKAAVMQDCQKGENCFSENGCTKQRYVDLPQDNCWEKDFTNEGLFHQWGCSYEEFESGAGNFTVAIVELTDGTIEQVLPSNLKFVDLP